MASFWKKMNAAPTIHQGFGSAFRGCSKHWCPNKTGMSQKRKEMSEYDRHIKDSSNSRRGANISATSRETATTEPVAVFPVWSSRRVVGRLLGVAEGDFEIRHGRHSCTKTKPTKLLKTLGSVPKSDKTIPISDTCGAALGDNARSSRSVWRSVSQW